MINLGSPRLQFTRDGKQVVAALADRVVMLDAAGVVRELAIAEVTSLAAFSDQIWAATASLLHRWDLDGQPIGWPVTLPDANIFAGDARHGQPLVLVPTFAGPAVAAAGGWLWLDDRPSLRAQPLDDGALPFRGRITVKLDRYRGQRIVRLGPAAWVLPATMQLIGAAPLFDGSGVALFVRRGDVNEVWISTAAGELQHKISLPPGELRLAARRGIAIVRTQPDSVVALDLRYGRVLGTAALGGDDLAIDPDGRCLAAIARGELEIIPLDDALRNHHQRRSAMSDFDEAAEATEKQREAAQKLMAVADVPGAGVLDVVNNGATVSKGVDEIEKGNTADGVLDVGIGGTGAVGGVADVVEMAAKAAGSSGVGGAAGSVASVAGAVSGGLTMGKGIGEIATDEGYGGKTMDGIHDLLTGGAGAAGAMAGPVGAVGKALGAGVAVGDLLAPVVFGDMKENGSHMEEIPEDGQYHASTGNRAIDWICGTGKYTDGRF